MCGGRDSLDVTPRVLMTAARTKHEGHDMAVITAVVATATAVVVVAAAPRPEPVPVRVESRRSS